MELRVLYSVLIELVGSDVTFLEDCVKVLADDICRFSDCVKRDCWCVAALRSCLVKIKPLPVGRQPAATPPTAFAARLEIECREARDAVEVVRKVLDAVGGKCKGVGVVIH